jgi:hypothetical protein
MELYKPSTHNFTGKKKIIKKKEKIKIKSRVPTNKAP